MGNVVTIVHVIVCLFLMLTVLLQSGKGGGMGSAFGGGSNTGSVFGGSGAGDFLRTMTGAAAAIFMITSILMAYLATSTGKDYFDRVIPQQQAAAERRAKADADAKAAAAASDDTAETKPDAETTPSSGSSATDENAETDAAADAEAGTGAAPGTADADADDAAGQP